MTSVLVIRFQKTLGNQRLEGLFFDFTLIYDTEFRLLFVVK